ncbi:hypothetical protein AB1L07_02485 [Niallia alba]|uniref:hypothetical protein n=1 Tax=Niallia alba TaxID=2729105 RepID=UPI00399F69E1
MCLYGTLKNVKIINPKQTRSIVPVDACISEEIQKLNNMGVITLNSCCGHGKAGEIIEWENAFGKWKGYQEPPQALVSGESVGLVTNLGYKPIPYYYADGKFDNVWLVNLKTGCITMDECVKWHDENGLEFIRDLGIVR